jgi:hypothetical protein
VTDNINSLLPCPFCGGSPELKHMGRHYGVGCATRTGKYQAQIEAFGTHYALGSSFATAEEAALARDAAAIRLHGEFAKLNFAASEPKKGE